MCIEIINRQTNPEEVKIVGSSSKKSGQKERKLMLSAKKAVISFCDFTDKEIMKLSVYHSGRDFFDES